MFGGGQYLSNDIVLSYDLKKETKMSNPHASTINSTTNIDSFSYRDLQQQCGKAGVAATGKTEVLRKRLKDHLHQNSIESTSNVAGGCTTTSDDVNPVAAKRQKRDQEDFLDIICPITRVCAVVHCK